MSTLTLFNNKSSKDTFSESIGWLRSALLCHSNAVAMQFESSNNAE